MSSHVPCNCGRKRGDHNQIAVIARHSRCSAFDGYRTKRSDYSAVMCTRPGCHGAWRTKAKYVNYTSTMTIEEVLKLRGNQ